MTINPSVGAGLGVCTPGAVRGGDADLSAGSGLPQRLEDRRLRGRSPIVAGTARRLDLPRRPLRQPLRLADRRLPGRQDAQRGVLVKVAGRLDADPATGRLTANFDDLPQLPYSDSRLSTSAKGSAARWRPRLPAATTRPRPTLTPWRDPNRGRASSSLPLPIAAGIGGGPCPQAPPPFAPAAAGGTLNSQAGAYSPFYLHLTRQRRRAGDHLLLGDLPARTARQARRRPLLLRGGDRRGRQLSSGVEERDNPSCPAASRIGRTYRRLRRRLGPHLRAGRPLSRRPLPRLPALGGRDRLGHWSAPSTSARSSIRSAIRIDPRTAQVSIDSAGTDPIPHIIDGIPIHLRDVRVYIDRPDFTVNPTSCDPRSDRLESERAPARASPTGSRRHRRDRHRPLQAFNCGALGFRPRISLRLRGGTSAASTLAAGRRPPRVPATPISAPRR